MTTRKPNKCAPDNTSRPGETFASIAERRFVERVPTDRPARTVIAYERDGAFRVLAGVRGPTNRIYTDHEEGICSADNLLPAPTENSMPDTRLAHALANPPGPRHAREKDSKPGDTSPMPPSAVAPGVENTGRLPTSGDPERVTHDRMRELVSSWGSDPQGIVFMYIQQQEQAEREAAELRQSLQTERAYKNGAKAKQERAERERDAAESRAEEQRERAKAAERQRDEALCKVAELSHRLGKAQGEAEGHQLARKSVEAERDALRTDLDESQRLLGNLLARIHAEQTRPPRPETAPTDHAANWDAAYALGREHQHADLMQYARRIGDQNPYRATESAPQNALAEARASIKLDTDSAQLGEPPPDR